MISRTWAGRIPKRFAVSSNPVGVVAYDESGADAASADFGDGEAFTLSLAPGTYQLVGTSGDAACQQKTIAVMPDRYETVRFHCGVR